MRSHSDLVPKYFELRVQEYQSSPSKFVLDLNIRIIQDTYHDSLICHSDIHALEAQIPQSGTSKGFSSCFQKLI